jgi:hypothetical protein
VEKQIIIEWGLTGQGGIGDGDDSIKENCKLKN